MDNLWENEAVRELVMKVCGEGIKISAICAAPIILARLGILDGKTAVCYPSCSEELQRADFRVGCGVASCDGIITGRLGFRHINA